MPEIIRVDANGRAYEVPDGVIADLSRASSARGRLQRAFLAVLLEHRDDGALPTSNRFGYYELRQRSGLIPLNPPTPRPGARGARRVDQNTIDASKYLRDIGLVPWAWIVDETRALYDNSYALTVLEHLRAEATAARVDPWQGNPPLIICESRTFGGVLRRTLGVEYGILVTATNGQVGGFLHTNIVPVLRAGHPDRPVRYVGDLDLSGGQIETNTRRVLERALGYTLNWERIALLQAQVTQHNLPVIQKIDRRYRPHRRVPSVEVESLGQTIVTGLVRAELDALLPEPLAVVAVREEAERQVALRLLGA